MGGRTGTLLLIALASCTLPAWSQESADLGGFLQSLEKSSPAVEVPLKDTEFIEALIRDASADEAVRLVPPISTAAQSQNVFVRMVAVRAMLAMALRNDSATLLIPALGALESMLNHPDPRLADGALLVLTWLRPAPPDEVVSIVLLFVQRADRDERRQAGAISLLMPYVEESFEVRAAVERFAARSLDPRAREELIKSIGLNSRPDGRFIPVLTRGLSDASEAVRAQAAQYLAHVGPAAVARAAVEIERLYRDDPDPEVRAQAPCARCVGG